MAYPENHKIETEGHISLSKDDGGPFAREGSGIVKSIEPATVWWEGIYIYRKIT